MALLEGFLKSVVSLIDVPPTIDPSARRTAGNQAENREEFN
jgi:hypothetical protein